MTIAVELQSATRARDGRPFVAVRMGRESVLLEPGEAREVAHQILELATAVEYEAALVRLLKDRGQSDEYAEAFVGDVVAERRRLRNGGVN